MKVLLPLVLATLACLVHGQPIHHVSKPVSGNFNENIIKYCVGITAEMNEIITHFAAGRKSGKHGNIEMGDAEGTWYYYEIKSSKAERRPRCPKFCRDVNGNERCTWWHVPSSEYKNANGDKVDLKTNHYNPSLFPECNINENMMNHLNYWYDRVSKDLSVPGHDAEAGVDFGYADLDRGFRMMDVGGGVICPIYCSIVGDRNDKEACIDHMSTRRTQNTDPRLDKDGNVATRPGKFQGCSMSSPMVNTWNKLYGYENERFWHENQISPTVQCPTYMALVGGGCDSRGCHAFRTFITRSWEPTSTENVAQHALYDHIRPDLYAHCGMSPAFKAILNIWSGTKRSGVANIPDGKGSTVTFDFGTASSFQFLSTPQGVCPVFCRSIESNSRACVYWHQEDPTEIHPPTRFTDCVGSLNFAGACEKPVTCDHRHGTCKVGSCFGAAATGECTECRGEVDGNFFAGPNCNIPIGCDERYGTCTDKICKGKEGNGECDPGSCQDPFKGVHCNICSSEKCSPTASAGACSTTGAAACECTEGFTGATCAKPDFPGLPDSFLSDTMLDKCNALKLKKIVDETKRYEANYCVRSVEEATIGDAAFLAVCGALTVNDGNLVRGVDLLEQAMLCVASVESAAPRSDVSLNSYILGLFEDTADNAEGERNKIGFRNSEMPDTVGWLKHPGLMSIYTLATQLTIENDYLLFTNPLEQILKRAIPLPQAEKSTEEIGLYFVDLHKTKGQLQKYCKTTCQCGEVIGINGCEIETNPIKLLEHYVLWSRCAALPETVSKIPRDLLVKRASTCVSISTLTSTIRQSVSDSISVTLHAAINHIRHRAQQLVQIQIANDVPLSTSVLQSLTVLQQNDVNLGSSYASLGNVHTVPHHVRIDEFQDYLQSFAERCDRLATFLITLSNNNEHTALLNQAKGLKGNNNSNDRIAVRAQLLAGFLTAAQDASKFAEETFEESESEMSTTLQDLQDAFDRIAASTSLYNEAASKVKEEQKQLLSDNLELIKELYDQKSGELLDELDAMLVERITTILDFTADMTGLAREMIEGIGIADILSGGGATIAKAALYAAEIGLRSGSFAETLIQLDKEIQSVKDDLLATDNRLGAVTNRLSDASNKIGETIEKIADQWVAIGFVIAVALPGDGEVVEAPEEIYSQLVQSPVYWENLNARVADVLQFEGLCSLETLSPAPASRRRLLEYQGVNTHEIETSINLRRQPVGDHMRRRLCESTGGKNSPPADCEPDVSSVPEDADANAEAVLRSARIDDLQGKLGTTCASFKTRVQGMTSYGQDAHETALRAVSLARRVGHLREVVRVQKRRSDEAKQETSAIQDSIEELLGDANLANLSVDELVDVVNLLHDAYITDNAVQLLSAGMARLLDLCNAITYVAPNRLSDIAANCQPFRSIPLDGISIKAFAEELEGILDKFITGSSKGFDDFVYDSIPQTSKASTMDVTHMLQPSLDEWVESNFNGSLSFGLRGPYAILEDDGVVYASSANRETQSGPYFCNHHNVQATSLGVIFLGEDDIPLGPDATLVGDDNIVVSISLSGTAVKTYKKDRFHYNIAPYKGIQFSYHLPSDFGCRTGEKIANLCRGDTQVNFGTTLPLPSPYMDWDVKLVKGKEFLKDVKRVVVVADFQSVNIDGEEMTCYRPPVFLRYSPSGNAGLIGGIVGGVAAAAIVPAAIWYAKSRRNSGDIKQVLKYKK